MTDSSLQAAVVDELEWEPSIDAAHIGVTAVSGIVTITGYVKSFLEKSAAERAVWRVAGVKAVVEELEVRLTFAGKYADAEIAAAIVTRLAWNAAIPPGSISVTIQNGVVTLTGMVEWYYQIHAVAQDVGSVLGVTGLHNQLTLKPKPNAADMRDQIMAALYRSWVDPSQIAVSVNAGAVTLNGKARNWMQRDLAAVVAWGSPGTVSVENAIVID